MLLFCLCVVCLLACLPVYLLACLSWVKEVVLPSTRQFDGLKQTYFSAEKREQKRKKKMEERKEEKDLSKVEKKKTAIKQTKCG